MTPHRMHQSPSRLAAALVLAGLVVAACGGGAPTEPSLPRDGPAQTLTVAQPGQLLGYVRDTVRTRAALRASGALAPTVALAGAPVPETVVAAADATVQPKDAASALTSVTGTTVHEAGVDEDDLLKTDGGTLYALRRAGWSSQLGSWPDRLQAYHRKPDGQLSPPQGVDLPSDPETHTSLRGMLLATEVGRLALVGESNTWFAVPDCMPGAVCVLPAWFYSAPRTTLQTVDVAVDPAVDAPKLRERLVIDGRLVATRQIGRHIYVVVRHSPELEADSLPLDATEAQREAALQGLRLDQVLPQVRIDGAAPRPLVDETDCLVQTSNASVELQVTVIAAFDIGAPQPAWTSLCVVGGTEAVYAAQGSLYLATSRDRSLRVDGLWVRGQGVRTDIHRFAFQDGAMAYRSSGVVDGHLGWNPDQAAYRMSEHGGDLRVLTFTGASGWVSAQDADSAAQPPSPATLTVLREEAASGALRVMATLPNAARPAALGLPGEQLHGVRFAGDRAYLVTFRQVDPLYVLDLSDPVDPKLSGELKLPGFSSYLFPLPRGMLLGVGRDATQDGVVGGVKVALFDVSDLASPARRASLVFGSRGSVSALDVSSRGIGFASVASNVRVALPLGLTDMAGTSFQQGLQLLEVATESGTLIERGWMPSSEPGWVDPGSDRGLLLGDHVYHWSQGVMAARAW